MNDLIYIFYGLGSEYVLQPLFIEMKKNNCKCIEIDALLLRNSKKIINNYIGKKIIFITSYHFLLNELNFKDFYDSKNTFYGVLEAISILKPLKSIFIPHDLLQPIINKEDYYLNQFDLFFSPGKPYTSLYSHLCKTIESGWIKYNKNTEQYTLKKNHNSAIWFLSDFILYIRVGKKEAFRKLGPILKQGVSIKFPKWSHSKEFEDYFRSKGATVFPSEDNSINLINMHDIIITNGLSSIVAESYLLGKKTVNIMDGSYYGNMFSKLEFNYPHVKYIDKMDDFNLSKIDLKSRPSVLLPFNMSLVLNTLLNIV